MNFANIDGVTLMLDESINVKGGNSGRGRPSSLRVELEENNLAKRWALSREEGSISGPFTMVIGIYDLLLVHYTVSNSPEIMGTNASMRSFRTLG